MPTATEEYIAARLTIKAEIVSRVTTLVPLALVLPQFTFDESDDNWPGMLRSSADNDEVHCIQVFFTGTRRMPRGDTPPGTMNPILPIGIGFFHRYYIAVDSNSEHKLDADVATVQVGLDQPAHLGLPSLVGGHDGLIVPRYSLTRSLGATGQIQYGLGTFEIEMQGLQLR